MENTSQISRIVILRLILLFILSILHQSVFSQPEPDSVKQTNSTLKYIEKNDTIISIKLNVNNEFERFEVNGSDFNYDIRPNISLSNKLYFSYRFISFGIGFKPKFIPGNNDNDQYGKTKALSFGVNIITKHWIQELQAAKVKGFYLHNTGDFDTEWQQNKDPYIQFPDLEVLAFRGGTGYKFNPNFSIKSISSQTEIQLKSCGSFVPYLSYDYYIIDNESSDSNQQSSQKSNNLDLIASIGYYYTFVIKSRFYASVGIIPGIGIQYTNLTTRLPDEEFKDKYNDPVFRSRERVGLGYNTKKLFAGMEMSFAHSSHKENGTSIEISATRMYFQVFIGYRFAAPKFLKKETDIIKETVPENLQKLLK